VQSFCQKPEKAMALHGLMLMPFPGGGSAALSALPYSLRSELIIVLQMLSDAKREQLFYIEDSVIVFWN
jgi:hypothetical protein